MNSTVCIQGSKIAVDAEGNFLPNSRYSASVAQAAALDNEYFESGKHSVVVLTQGSGRDWRGDEAAASEISSQIKMPCKLLNLQGIFFESLPVFQQIKQTPGQDGYGQAEGAPSHWAALRPGQERLGFLSACRAIPALITVVVATKFLSLHHFYRHAFCHIDGCCLFHIYRINNNINRNRQGVSCQ